MHQRNAGHNKMLENALEQCKISQNKIGRNLERVPKMSINRNTWFGVLFLKHPNCSREKGMQQNICDSSVRRKLRVAVPSEMLSLHAKGRNERVTAAAGTAQDSFCECSAQDQLRRNEMLRENMRK